PPRVSPEVCVNRPGTAADDPLLPTAITEIRLPESYTVRAISEDGPYKTVAGGSHRWPASEGGPYNSQAVRQISPVLSRPASESRPYKTVARLTQAEAYATKARQRRGAGAMVASSGGSGKRTSSRIRSR